MGPNPAETCWVIICVLVLWTCVDAWPVSAAGARVGWAVTWSPGNELHHLAVDPVSGKVTVIYVTVLLRPKLHYTDTGNGHHQRTSSQQFYNKFATSQCQSPTSRHVKMLGCGKFLSVGGEFVVQQVVKLLRARPMVVSVAGVRVVEFGT